MDLHPHTGGYLCISEVDTCSAAGAAHGRVPALALFDFIFVMQR